MGAAGWLRLAVTTVAAQRQIDGGFQVDQVTRRDVDRVHPVLRAHRRAHDFSLVDQRRARPAFRSRFGVPAHQHALGAAERRQPEPQPRVRRDPDPARMGDPLPVEHHRVRLPRQLLPRLQHRRSLAERQQPRDVWKARAAHQPHLCHRLQRGQPHHHDPDVDRLLELVERDVRARHRVDRSVRRMQPHLAPQRLLQFDGFRGS